jgi:putative Mg2+ transporter-C (MgtC) family protein
MQWEVSAALASGPAGLPGGQGWLQAGELGLALVLSACIGLEREIRQKNAGLRTHTLVGLGAALFMLVSKYGFNDVLHTGLVVLDPSRVAAQIVTGIGFLGAGLIFVRRDYVRGLTTAAAIWVTAAIGAAAGAGLGVLATEATAGFLLVTSVFPAIARRLPRTGWAGSDLRIRYPDGRGVLRRLLQTATGLGFTIGAVTATPVDGPPAAGPGGRDGRDGRRMVEVSLRVHGKYPVSELAAALAEIDDVDTVLVEDTSSLDE